MSSNRTTKSFCSRLVRELSASDWFTVIVYLSAAVYLVVALAAVLWRVIE